MFVKRNFAAYLFLKNEFVFMDYTESKMPFYLDYLALMGLCIFIVHYGSRFIKKYKDEYIKEMEEIKMSKKLVAYFSASGVTKL